MFHLSDGVTLPAGMPFVDSQNVCDNVLLAEHL